METSASLETRFHSRLSTDAARCWLCCWLPWCPLEEFSRLKYGHCEATLTLKASAVILEHAGGEGRFWRSGITETFGITIKRKADVDAAANAKVEKKKHNHPFMERNASCHPPLTLVPEEYTYKWNPQPQCKKSPISSLSDCFCQCSCFFFTFYAFLTLWSTCSLYLALISFFFFFCC